MSEKVRGVDNVDVYRRDESNLKTIPNFFPTFMGICSVVSVILVIIIVVQVVKGLSSGNYNTLEIAVPACILGVILVISWYGDTFLNWRENFRYEIKGSDIKCRYELPGAGLASTGRTVTIKLEEVEGIKETKNLLIIKGKFDVRKPLTKPKTVNRVKLQIDNFSLKDKECILNALHEKEKEVQ